MNALIGTCRNTGLCPASKLAALLLALVAADAGAAVPTTYTVTNTGDAATASTCNGIVACSLRQAIDDANGNAGPDTIEFNINTATDAGCAGTPKICTIHPSAILDLTSPVYVNGYSQAGASANTQPVGNDAQLRIEIDGTGLGTVFQLHAGASGSTFRGLIVSNFFGVGIYIGGGAGDGANNVTVAGNFVGTNRSGTAATSIGDAVNIYASTGALIGGPAPADRNVLAASSAGLFLNVASSNVVQGNYLGINAAGTAALPGGGQFGIDITNNSSGNQIGGSASGTGNVIGCGTSCVTIGDGCTNNILKGNLMGTDANGSVAFGGQDGVTISDSGNQIGGTAAGEGNLISGLGNNGVLLYSGTGNVIQGNLIGTDFTGALPLPNGACGINVWAAATGGTIGGKTAGAGNRIAYSAATGICLQGTGWAILGNSIHSSGNLGITLTGSANPTPNDLGDGDTGANNLQNYPVITAVTIGPKTQATVSGTLNSSANKTYRVEFFANASCDPSGNGEGKKFLGSTNVTTVGNDGAFGPIGLAVPADRHVITATATDPDNNTSEFSVCGTQDTIFSDGAEIDDNLTV
jgi:hypothetical protein